MSDFYVGQTVECVDGYDGWGHKLLKGHRYTVTAVAGPWVYVDGGRIGLDGWGANRFRAVEPPSLIDPDKWIDARARHITDSTGSWSCCLLALWCLTNSAAVLLGALVDALPSKPVRTWDDYPLWSVWAGCDGVWTVDCHGKDIPTRTDMVYAYGRATADWFTFDQMADWVCLSMPVVTE